MLFPFSVHAIEDNNKAEVENNDKQENTARQTPRLFNDILPDLTQIINTAKNTRFSDKKLTIQQNYDILRKLVINPAEEKPAESLLEQAH